MNVCHVIFYDFCIFWIFSFFKESNIRGGGGDWGIGLLCSTPQGVSPSSLWVWASQGRGACLFLQPDRHLGQVFPFPLFLQTCHHLIHSIFICMFIVSYPVKSEVLKTQDFIYNPVPRTLSGTHEQLSILLLNEKMQRMSSMGHLFPERRGALSFCSTFLLLCPSPKGNTQWSQGKHRQLSTQELRYKFQNDDSMECVSLCPHLSVWGWDKGNGGCRHLLLFFF